MNNDNELGIYSILALAFIYSYYFNDANEWFSDDNTIYYSYCSDSLNDIEKCPSKEIQLKMRTFTANANAQIVMSKIFYGINKFSDNCVVKDRDNWSCTESNWQFIMNNGEYIEANPNGKVRLNKYYTSKWSWFWSSPIKAALASWDN